MFGLWAFLSFPRKECGKGRDLANFWRRSWGPKLTVTCAAYSLVCHGKGLGGLEGGRGREGMAHIQHDGA